MSLDFVKDGEISLTHLCRPVPSLLEEVIEPDKYIFYAELECNDIEINNSKKRNDTKELRNKIMVRDAGMKSL